MSKPTPVDESGERHTLAMYRNLPRSPKGGRPPKESRQRVWFVDDIAPETVDVMEKIMRSGLGPGCVLERDGVVVEERSRLREGELLPPTSDGFRQFVGLAPPTRLTFTDLDEVAQAWWFRPFPRGYLTEARQAAAAAAAEREAATQALAAPTLTDPRQNLAADLGASAGSPAGPGLTVERQAPPAAGPGLTVERQPSPAPPADVSPADDFTLDSTLGEVLAALKAADPAAHALAERGDWTRLAEHGGPLAERAYAWARYHRQLPAQRRAAERLEVDAAIRGLGLAPELQAAYLDQLATAFEHGGDMRAVLAEATAHTRPSPPPLLADLAPVPGSAGQVHFTVERQELTRALLTAKVVREAEDSGLGKIQVACHGTAILRVGTAGVGRPQSFFELRLLTTRCQREGAVTVQGRALHDALRTFGSGPIEIVKAEGHNVLKLRQRALETNLPSVDYVPIDPGSGDMTPAGVITLDQLRDMLAAVVHVARVAESTAKHLAVVRFDFEDGRLHLVATDGERLVRVVRALPGGEALGGLQLAVADADRLHRLLGAHWQTLHPKDDPSPARLSLSVRTGNFLSGEYDALRFTVPHDPREFPNYANAIPKKIPDVVVVSHSELRAQLYAARRVFDDGAPAVAELRVCDNGVRVRATHPHNGEVAEYTIKDASSYGRPFVRTISVSRMLDVLENLPTASHHAIACDAEVFATPIVVMPWPHHGIKTRTRTQVWEFVALGLRVGTFALVMPLRTDKENDHGCTR